MRLIASPSSGPIAGNLAVPGDKSVSHRAVILAALAEGTSTIRGWLDAEDTRATLNACQALGADAVFDSDGLQVTGRGGQFKQPQQALDLGNSGTGVRLLLGAVAGQPLTVEMTGDASLRRRPMGRIVRPLQQMGARFEYAGDADGPITLPLRSLGPDASKALHAIEYSMPVASAQVQAAILLAGLQADGVTRIHQPGPCRDHSERMLQLFSADIRRESPETLTITPSKLQAAEVQVPGDFSSAAFLLQAALLVPGSALTLHGVGVNPTRTGLLEVIRAMGGQVEVNANAGHELAEPLAELRCGSARLHGCDIPPELVSNCIDEFPMIMALAAAADGVTRIRGAAELRVKESDRIAVMATALQQLGIEVKEYADGADITGGKITGGRLDAHGDHRIAMSLAVLGLVAQQPVAISNAQAIATSYPGFVDDLNRLGATLAWCDD